MTTMMNICELPQDCLALILSLTSPTDVVRSSAVSKLFLLVSQSDTVWDAFLPSDCDHIFSRSSSPILRDQFGSKKDLFFYLSRFPVLLNDNTASFGLEKRNGKICYMLGARPLSVIWGDTPEYWTWESVSNSRFPECARLNYVFWLEIKGKIQTSLLSQGTTYGAYFVFNILSDLPNTTGFGDESVKVSVSRVGEDGLPIDGNNNATKEVYLEGGSSVDEYEWREDVPTELLPRARGDGWMEVEMGRCEVGVDDGARRVILEMVLKEIENLHFKNNLVVHGIELRPLS